MQINADIQGMQELAARLIDQIRDRNRFVKLWANSAAIQARNTARGKGGRRFWRDLARSIQVRSITDLSAEITSAHRGANQKQYGGVIRPVNARALTVPISPEAKRRTAYEFERSGRRLFVIPRESGDTAGILGYSKKTKGGSEFHPLFVLRKKVTQAPDPWFPSDAQVWRLAADEARRMIDKEQRQWNTH